MAFRATMSQHHDRIPGEPRDYTNGGLHQWLAHLGHTKSRTSPASDHVQEKGLLAPVPTCRLCSGTWWNRKYSSSPVCLPWQSLNPGISHSWRHGRGHWAMFLYHNEVAIVLGSQEQWCSLGLHFGVILPLFSFFRPIQWLDEWQLDPRVYVRFWGLYVYFPIWMSHDT